MINVYRPSCEVFVFIIRFHSKLIFFYRIDPKFELLNFMKIHPLGNQYFRAVRRIKEGTDEQTDVIKIIFFCNSAKALTE
jgi:hypothetical protein